MNLKIAAALYDVALPRENYELPQLAAVLLAQPQKRPEDWNALLGFARHVLQDCNASSQQLYRCLCAVALNSGEFADMVEVAEFKHWAVEKAGLWRCGWDPVQNVFRSRGSFRETDSTAFVVFMPIRPILWIGKIAARPVARHGSETAGPPGSGRNHRRPPLRGKTGFSAEGRFGKTRRMGACPSRRLARNAALTGDAFTCCPAIAAAPVPGCFRSPGALLFPAPRRAGFFYPPCKKHLHFQINLINILPLPF